jgi:hypothetical protein
MLNSPVGVFALITIVAATICSIMVSRRTQGGFFLRVVFLPAALGFGAMIALFVAYFACHSAGACPQTTSENVWFLGFPIVAVPLYWLVVAIDWFNGRGLKGSDDLS